MPADRFTELIGRRLFVKRAAVSGALVAEWLLGGKVTAAEARRRLSKPVNTTAPTIAGTPNVGDTLTANVGAWAGNPTPTYVEAWSNGQTGSSIVLKSTDVGKDISVTVTARNYVGSAQATSSPVGPIAALAPTVSSVTLSNVTETGATLTATVNPNGVATQAYFAYGPTTSYGASTAAQSLGSGTTSQQLQATIDGLEPGTEYHVQAVATQ